MLHCHQFVHHPSIRPSKWSSLFGNSSHGSCVLQQLTSANINDAFSAEDSQHCNGKGHRCISSRIRQRFHASSIATALQTSDLQEQIRKISFHDRVEFFNLFQHQHKYFPNSANPRKRARDGEQPARIQPEQHSTWLDDLSVAQISQMIRKKENDQREKLGQTERREPVDTTEIAVDYVHTSLFGPNYSAKIVPAADKKQPRHKRSLSSPSKTASKPTSSNTGAALSNDFFLHFPAESLSLVGVGAFGRVYRIHSNDNAFNDDRLAVKLIPFNSSKQERRENSNGGAGNKYGAPILAAAAMLAAVHAEEEQLPLEGDDCSTEAQVLREVSVLSALSSPNTARYRWGWVESWSTQFEELFHSHSKLKEQPAGSPSKSASVSASASFSDTSSEWTSSNSSASEESNRSPPQSRQESSCASSSKPEYDSVLVLLMDYYTGISLSEFISNPSAHLPAYLSHTSVLSSLFRLYVSYQILSSLEYLHAHQCIHRDLAPKNLIVEIDRALLSSSACQAVDEQRMDSLLVRLMSSQISVDEVQDSAEWNAICSIMAAFNVRLIDFGLSRHLTKESNAQEAQNSLLPAGMELSVGVGTRAYAPPEQLKRIDTCACKHTAAGGLSPSPCEVCKFADRGDIFSCGLLMAEMLCAPFQTQMERIEFLSRMRDRRWAQVESFQTLPRVLKDLLTSMLNPAANNRPSAAEAKKSKTFYAVRKLMPFIVAQRYERGCA